MSQAVILSATEQEYLLRIIESAAGVRDLRQFFLWSQGQLQALLPHELMICMQFAPDGSLLRLEAVHGSVIDDTLLQRLCDPQTGLALQLARGGSAGAQQLAACGFEHVLMESTGPVSGGASVFMLLGMPVQPDARHTWLLALLLPQLHLALGRLAGAAAIQPGQRSLSQREAQVMHWLRAGKRNDEIAHILGLSALTVKNHLQRIYKVLGVRNRTEAVARSAQLSPLSGEQ